MGRRALTSLKANAGEPNILIVVFKSNPYTNAFVNHKTFIQEHVKEFKNILVRPQQVPNCNTISVTTTCNEPDYIVAKNKLNLSS